MIVEHVNDLPTDNRAENLRWGSHEANRAQRTANRGQAVPPGKKRRLYVRLDFVRALQLRSGLKGRGLAEYIEQLIAKAALEPKDGSGA